MTEEPQTSRSAVHGKEMKPNPELARGTYSTVHTDKAMLTIDYEIDTVTITLLNMHMIPLPRLDDWGVENIMWDIVGEVKIPIPVLNALLIYYASQISNGLDITPLLEKHLREHPRSSKQALSFGPTSFKRTPIPPTQEKEQRNQT